VITVAFLSLLVSGVTILPELHSLAKNHRYWLPLNTHPMTVGDDYHYFTILNRLTLKKLKARRFNFQFEVPARANITQLIPQLFNLIPFIVGVILLDRRLGLLFVRLFDRFMFFFSCVLVSNQIWITFLDYSPSKFLLFANGLLLFLLFPGPLSFNTRQSLIRNLSNDNFIFEKNRTSDLSRAYVLETVLPIYLVSTYYLFRFSDNHSSFVAVALILTILNLLAYPPLGIVFLCQTLSLATLFKIPILVLIPVAVIAFIFLVFLDRYIRGDAYGSETYTISNLPFAGIKFAKWNSLQLLLTAVPILSIVFFHPRFAQFLGSIAIFIIFDLTSHHNFSRIWFRGASPVFQLYFLVYVMYLLCLLSNLYVLALMVVMFIFLLYFYARQSKILNQIGYFYIAPEYRGVFELLTQTSIRGQSVLIVSNDTEVLKLAALYSCHHVHGLHHGLSKNDYESQLKLLANTYRFLSIPYRQFQADLTVDFDYFAYLNLKKTEFSFPNTYEVNSFCKQMFATYSIFSEEMSNLGYLVGRKWTHDFDAKLKQIWDSTREDDILLTTQDESLRIEQILRTDDRESNTFSINHNSNI